MKILKYAVILFSLSLASTAQTASPAQSPIPDKQIVATQGAPNSPDAELHPKAAAADIPQITHRPTLGDFAGMKPGPEVSTMLRIANFTQTFPTDGAAPTERTEVYLGYDHQSLYVVWLCFDSNPRSIRAHMARRENIYDDDYVELTLDTFHDKRHGLVFANNPLGIQAEGLWTEGTSDPDNSWDTVWNSAGQVTDKGYMVLQEIPFISLRFKSLPSQIWGVTLFRSQTRKNEADFWPWVSAKVSGRLNQEGTLKNFNAEPGRNLQLIPYVYGRSFRAVDDRDPLNPRYQSKTFQGKLGLDAKYVFHNNLVLDVTANPDFSQVESDDPQNTVNQRFEVFFPEKRPFFLENSNFFENLAFLQNDRLLFTRRIADPDAGIRLTGKQGPWNLGFFAADDRSPGKIVPPGDPLEGKRAYFTVARVAHDVGAHNSLGVIYTDREFNGEYNRVGGFDGTFKFMKNWNAGFRSVIGSTYTNLDGYKQGWDHDAYIFSDGQHAVFFSEYQDISPDFVTETGFVRRRDMRRTNNYYHYYWHTDKSKIMQQHGPELGFERIWDHHGTGVEYNVNTDYVFGFHRNLLFAPIVGIQSDTLRPEDASGLTANRKFNQDFGGLVFRGQPVSYLKWSLNLIRTGTINLVAPAGQAPAEGDETTINLTLGVKPIPQLQIDNTYILDHVRFNRIGRTVFDNHIIRSKWNYQINRELSVRVITQYNGLLPNPNFTSLTATKSFNFDFLITYLLHPGTAMYIGYNSDLANIDPGLCVKVAGVCDPNGNGLLRNQNMFINDGRQFFVKLSYLFRR